MFVQHFDPAIFIETADIKRQDARTFSDDDDQTSGSHSIRNSVTAVPGQFQSVYYPGATDYPGFDCRFRVQGRRFLPQRQRL